MQKARFCLERLMTVSESSSDQAHEVASLISHFASTLERDGYSLEWTLDQSSRSIDARVIAGPNACEECLVPKQLMIYMLESSLDGSGISLRSLTLPADASPKRQS